MRDEADNLLRLFLNATDKAKETRLLEQLIGEHALPRIRQILRAKLRGDWMQDLEDLIHDVALLLVNKLRKLVKELLRSLKPTNGTEMKNDQR
jgi:hypothetical protein